MAKAIQTRVEGARGCGYRKPGGLYLVSGDLSEPCPLLPFETATCPTCGEGIRPARGFTWVDGEKLIPPTKHGTAEHNAVCPLAPVYGDVYPNPQGKGWVVSDMPGVHTKKEAQRIAKIPQSRIGRCGLIWVGEQFYPTPQSFMREAAEMGVSRRITQVPREFEVGKTWVLLGHRKAATKACPDCGDEPGGDADCPVCEGVGFVHVPGIITAFRPTAIEYVVKGDETDDEIEAIEKRGITPVRVINDDPQESLEV